MWMHQHSISQRSNAYIKPIVVAVVATVLSCALNTNKPDNPKHAVQQKNDTHEHTDKLLKLTLIQNQPTAVGDVTITLVSAGYAHMKDDRNLSNVKLTLTKGGQEVTVHVSREHPGNPNFVKAFDLAIALEQANAYNTPISADLIVKAH